jgi:hypothetical protein
MPGLYVPLDVEYASDDKLIEAGPMAELLYIRSLAFSKRRRSDGAIRRSQIAAVAHGIPAAAKHAARLVEVGAWTATPDGWRITAWLRHNKSAADIKADSDAKKAASALANHRRWHVGEGKEPSLSCHHCYPRSDPKPDPKPDTLSESIREGKTEGEGREDRGRGKGEGESSSSETSASQPTPPPDDLDDDRFAAALEQIVDAKVGAYQPDRPKAYRMKVRSNTINEDGEVMRRLLAEGSSPEAVALFVLGYGETSDHAKTPTIPWCGTDCPTCDGTAWIYPDEDGPPIPCPNRKADTA